MSILLSDNLKELHFQVSFENITRKL